MLQWGKLASDGRDRLYIPTTPQVQTPLPLTRSLYKRAIPCAQPGSPRAAGLPTLPGWRCGWIADTGRQGGIGVAAGGGRGGEGWLPGSPDPHRSCPALLLPERLAAVGKHPACMPICSGSDPLLCRGGRAAGELGDDLDSREMQCVEPAWREPYLGVWKIKCHPERPLSRLLACHW